jgi:hypothetical protein
LLQELHGVTSQKTALFIVTAVKTSNLTFDSLVYTSLLHVRAVLFIVHSSLYCKSLPKHVTYYTQNIPIIPLCLRPWHSDNILINLQEYFIDILY